MSAFGKIVCLLVLTFVASEATALDFCFEVQLPHATGPQEFPILINKCTGDTWLLVKTSGKIKQTFTYEWAPLLKNNFAPTFPTAPIYAPVPGQQ